jgi:hypothetical protein
MAGKHLPSPEVLRQLLKYDAETGRLFWKLRDRSMFGSDRAANTWNSRYAGREAFTAKTRGGYRVGRVGDTAFYAHRVIWAITHGEWPDQQIDHINGDTSDNRLENLRAVCCVENGRNTKIHAHNTSGLMGVCWDSSCQKWAASITVRQRKVALGRFPTFDEAANARAAAEAKYGFHPNHGR